jgi:DNA recombination protein RmuC
MSPEVSYFLFLLGGLLIGGLSAWLIAKYHFIATRLSREEIEQQYVAKSEAQEVAQQLELMRERYKMLEQQYQDQHQNFEQLQQHAKATFENIAHRLLEEKSQKFSTQNQTQIQQILQPLKEKIKEFEEGIEKRFLEDAKEKLSLKLAIDQLRELNLQLSTDANNLVNALKGDSKTQGNWGEYQLEMLLKKAGLEKDIHFLIQPSYKDEQGREKRPDFVINLPEEKHLIIDCKVSLTAYERYFNAETPQEQQKHLKAHIESLRQHIRDLSSKNYQLLYDIQAPDYLLLYVPIEPAFALAVREEQRLFLDALDKNIVLVSSTTLLATMRTVAYIWKQEKQKRSVLEIARQSGLLYDRFVNFVDDLKMIGQRLDGAHKSYKTAMSKLVDGHRYGDTLIGRAEKIRSLGAKATKLLPQDLIDQALDKGEPDTESPGHLSE